jgi:predicted nucleotidyltransferase component of viral defense system
MASPVQKPHLEILVKEPAEPKEVLAEEAYRIFNYIGDLQFIGDFYLAGGTGLALQIGHRISIDFDFFTDKNKLSLSGREKILSELRRGSDITVESQEEGTLTVRLDNTLVSFFHYPYPLIEPTRKVGDVGVASLADIAAMKLSAIVSRGTKKDFVDLYFIIRDHVPLKNVLELGERKFKDVRDFHVQGLKALVYFEDAEKERIPKMTKKVAWQDIKKFFSNAVSEEMRSEIR